MLLVRNNRDAPLFCFGVNYSLVIFVTMPSCCRGDVKLLVVCPRAPSEEIFKGGSLDSVTCQVLYFFGGVILLIIFC